MNYYVPHDDTSPVEMLPGVVRRTTAITDRLMVCEFTLRQGSSVPLHSHHHDQCGYIISGRAEFIIGGEKRILGAGDSYAIPGGVDHTATALEETLLVDVFTPPRDEYR